MVNSDNTDHYKNLSYGMKEFKRVHIDSHFVLIFKVEEGKKLIKCQKFSTSFKLVTGNKSVLDYEKFLSMLKNHPDAVNNSNIPPIYYGWFLTFEDLQHHDYIYCR